MSKRLVAIVLTLACLLIGCTSKAAVQETGVPATEAPASAPTEIVVSASETPTPNPDVWDLVWADEFDQANGSAPDPAKWNHQTGGAGWGNGELQHYSDRIENSFIQDGMLVIQANKEYMLG